MITPEIKDGVLEIIVIEYPEMYGTLNLLEKKKF